MPSTLENSGENKVKIIIGISPEKLEEGVVKAYNEMKNEVNIPGFRRGRVPRKVIELQFGKEVFYDDAINHILSELYEEALDEHKLDPVSRPEVEVTEISAEAGATAECVLFVRPEAKVLDYFGLTYKDTPAEAGEDEIQAEIDRVREKNARIITVLDRPLREGDIAVIDFEGFADETPFPGGKGENHELAIGSNTFIPGFEERLIGMEVGESRAINVTFPEEYHAEDLAGKPAVFNVTLNEIKYKELPEVNDEFAQETSEFDTLEEYRNDVRGKITKQKEAAAKEAKESQVIKGLIDRTVVDIPEAMIETELDGIIDSQRRHLASMGLDFEKYLEYMNTTPFKFRQEHREQAGINVKARLALDAVAKAENIVVTDDDIRADFEKFAGINGFESPDDMMEHLAGPAKENISRELRIQKALELIMGKAVAVEDEEPEAAE